MHTASIVPPLGVILAGGQSRRMGQDKAMLPFGRGTLLDHCFDRLSQQCDSVIVNSNVERHGYTVVPDPMAGALGPLAGILAGMEWGKAHGHTHIVTIAADTPFFPTDYVSRLCAAQDARIVLSDTTNGCHPTFGIWDVTLALDLRDALDGGVRKIRDWAFSMGASTVAFETASVDPFFNINTPDDYHRALEIYAGQP
jgi:molybdopterin-guanine dinucleotide biosynthesis protein A